MADQVINQAETGTPAQLTRFGSLTFKIVGGASTAVAAVTALYGTVFSPDTDLLRLLALAAVLFGLITTGIAAGLLMMKQRVAVAGGEGQVVTPAFSAEERKNARKLLLPFAGVLFAVAVLLFVADRWLTPKIYDMSLLEGDSEVLRIHGSGFGHDPHKLRVRFSQESQEEFVASNVRPDGLDVAVPPKFQKGNISVRRGPRWSPAVFFSYPGVIYDVAVVEMMRPTEVDSLAALADQFEPFPGFPYFSDTSDKPTQWPPRVDKDRTAFAELMKAQLSGAAGEELRRWETHAKQDMSIVGDDGELSLNQSYMRLRNLLRNSNGDLQRVRAVVGPNCARALDTLEQARHKLSTRLPNRLLILSVHNSQIQDVENFTVEVKIGGAVYDATVNEEGEKARSLQWSPDRIDIDIPRLRPGYTANVQVWYYFMGPDKRVFADAADFEWARTQGVVIGNMGISNGQLRRSQKLLADLGAYHRYPVDPVRASPTFGQVVNVPGMRPEGQERPEKEAPKGTSQRSREGSAQLVRVALIQSDPQAGADDHLIRGKALYVKNDLDGAIREYRAAIRINPKIADAHLYLGAALDRKGDSNAAIPEYRAALRIYPDRSYVNSVEAHNRLGGALAKTGDLEGAIAEFRAAVRLKPDNSASHLGLGMALQEKKQLDEALGEYRQALALDPKSKFIRERYDYLSGFLGKK